MKAKLIAASFCVAALVFSLEEASSAGKTKFKGKSPITPFKGTTVAKAKDVVPQVKPLANPALSKEKLDGLKTSSPNWTTTPSRTPLWVRCSATNP